MAAASTKVNIIFKPKRGPHFSVIFHVPGAVVDPNDAGIQAILAALNALTRAVAIEITLSVSHENTATATAAAPYTSGDKFLLITKDVDDIAHNFKLPGLKTSIVAPDTESVDITAGVAKTFADAIVAHAVTPGNTAIAHAISGRRAMNRKPIKGTGVVIVP
jgi:hypothetical protein